MEPDQQQPEPPTSPADQTLAHTYSSPADMVIQRLLKLGVPWEYLEKGEKGLVQYVKGNKWKLQDVISALLPGIEEVLDGFCSSSDTEEPVGTLVWREFKQRCREGLRWVQWLMFEGEPGLLIEDIGQQTGGLRGVCGAVWGSNDVAYRCRTCEQDLTCAICVPCFRAGNHLNHDYSMIHTNGGCCDCGDITAWKASGFCSRHRGPGKVAPLPEAFVSSVNPVLRVLLQEWARRLLKAEKVSERNSKKWDKQAAEEKVASKISGVITEMLLVFCNCSESMLSFTAGLVGSDKVGLLDTLLRTECFLPRKVVVSLHELLFKLMGDSTFKYQFAKSFILHYPRLLRDAIRGKLEPAAGSHGGNPLKDNSSLYKFSVQIFTVPTLTSRLVVELKLLDMLLGTMKELFLACAGDDGRLVVSKSPIFNSLYYRVLRDVQFVMSHLEVAQYVAKDRPDLFKAWLHLLAYTQGMDPQRRVTSIHVEEESDSWAAAYCLELQMARIHSLYIGGVATTSHVNCMEGTIPSQMDISCEEDPEDEAVLGRHAKIGRISKQSDFVWITGINGGTMNMELDSRGGDAGAVDGGCGQSNTSSDAMASAGASSQSISIIPTAFLWLISECTKVLGTWLLLDWSRDLARSKRSSLKEGEGVVQRKGVHWRGRGGRGVRRDSYVLNSIESGGGIVDGEQNPGQRGTLREWLRRAGELGAAIRAATGASVGRRATHSLPQNVEEGIQMDDDMSLEEMDMESIEVADNGGSEDNESLQWWMGSDMVDSWMGPGFTWNDNNKWLGTEFDVSWQEVSLYIPLHRLLALLLQQCIYMFTVDAKGDQSHINKPWQWDEQSLGSPSFLLHLLPAVYRVQTFVSKLMEHPLRIQVFCAQVRAGMWRRNGHTVLALCDYYHSVRWCEESLDLDLFLLQCCGVMTPPGVFVERILDRFGLSEYFSLFLLRPNEYETTLAQEMLAFVVRIVSERGFCGLSTVEALRRELIRRLAISDATHSQLIKSLPPRLSGSKHLQETLDAIAIFCNPSGMNQGKYSLRKECWKELDVYHPRWSRRELQSAEDRYFHVCKASAVTEQLPRWRKPFTPLLSLCRIATCKRVHDILRSVFFHAAFSERLSESRAPEGVLITALHLLSLGLDICSVVFCKQEANRNQWHGSCDPCHGSSAPSLLQFAQDPPPLLAQATEKVYVRGADGSEISGLQSLLSLLVMLMERYNSGQVHGVSVESNHCNIGNLIKSLLGKFAELHRGCMYEIKSIAPEILDRVLPVLKWRDSKPMIKDQEIYLSEAEKRKALARERQAAVMAKMKSEQEKFMASLQPSDQSYNSERSKPENDLDGKNLKDMESGNEMFPCELAAIVCSLCHDSGSKSPTSFLTFVQRSRLLEIAERGIPSWERGLAMGADETISMKTGAIENWGGSDDGEIPESENSVELFNWIRLVLSGDMDRERLVEDLLGLLRHQISENADTAQRMAGHGTTDVGMLNSLWDDLGHFDQTEGIVDKDEYNKTRENALAAVLVEYFKILLRNLKEQKQLVESEIPVVSPGPQSRTSSRRASDLNSIKGLAHDSVGVHMSSCGHAVHKECLDRYLSSLSQRYYSRTHIEGLQIVDPDQGEFLCPVCRRLANSVLPVLQTGSSTDVPIWQSSAWGNASSSSDSSTSARISGSNGSLKVLRLQEAMSFLHKSEELIWKLVLQKAVSKPLPNSTTEVCDFLFLRLLGLYFPEKEKVIQGRVCQSLLLWDVLRYSLLCAELAARTRKSIFHLSEPDNHLDALWKESNSSNGSVLLLLILAAKATQSLNRQTVLLRARGIQLLVGSICYGVSKDSVSELSIQGSISKILKFIDKGGEAADIQFFRHTADPVLAHDPFSSLVWLVFCLPPPFPSSKEPFITLVHLLYLVCVTQVIAFIGKPLALHPQLPAVVQVFVQSVLTTLSDCQLFLPSAEYYGCMVVPGAPLVAIQHFTLPYLRRCVLLERLLFNRSCGLHLEEKCSLKNATPYTAASTRNTFDLMSRTIREDITDLESRELEELEKCFFIPPLQAMLEDENSREVMLRWCQHLSKEMGFRKLPHIPQPTTATPFQLMRLPTLYHDLLQRYIKECCPVCATVPDQPALCLLCGTLCCGNSRRSCCSANRQSECYRHAMTCGAGIGVFLMIRKTNIFLQRCSRQASWPSPYLDAFGEEDIEMSRGKPLYLSEERYAALTAMVALHGLDHSSLVLYHTTREAIFRG